VMLREATRGRWSGRADEGGLGGGVAGLAHVAHLADHAGEKLRCGPISARIMLLVAARAQVRAPRTLVLKSCRVLGL